MSSTRTTPHEDVADLLRIIRRVQVIADDSTPTRGETARNLLKTLHAALDRARAMGHAPDEVPPRVGQAAFGQLFAVAL